MPAPVKQIVMQNSRDGVFARSLRAGLCSVLVKALASSRRYLLLVTKRREGDGVQFLRNPSLTPAQISSYLQFTARPFPANTICTSVFPGQCGAGLLDAYVAQNAVRSDCLFNWAERSYPHCFAPSGSASQTYSVYYLRYYSRTANYLATSSADNRVYALGRDTGNVLLDLGPATSFLGMSGCQ